MGDTGSLAIGGGLASLAIMSKTQLLLPFIAGLFVIVTLSSIIQIVVFRTTGKRFFKMAPLHHHFEILGWHEITIVVRFWLIQGVLVALGVGLFYSEWVRQ
jgi:phospho-N-acetylmuramoyl-pentapeptide-transferase